MNRLISYCAMHRLEIARTSLFLAFILTPVLPISMLADAKVFTPCVVGALAAFSSIAIFFVGWMTFNPD